MKKKLLFFLLLFSSLLSTAQSKKKLPSTSSTGPVSFPKDFIGSWKGKLQWFVAGKKTEVFSMQLHIKPVKGTAHYTWQIVYGDNKTDDRPYIIRPVDTVSGHWIIDERNGILLDSYVHGNSIHGAFTVQGNTIVDNYKVEKISATDYRMQVEFFTIMLADKQTSGGGTENSPFVDSYRMAGYQTGVLKKLK